MPLKYQYSYRLQRFHGYEYFPPLMGDPGDTFSTVYSANWNNTKVGFPLPWWQSYISRGLNATTDFSASKQDFTYDGGYCSVDLKVGIQTTRYFVSGPLAPPGAATDPSTLSIGNANSDALSKFYREVRSSRQSFQGGVFLGELAETIRLIKNPLREFRYQLDKYVSSARSRARRIPKKDIPRVLENTWLEYQYGWKPLISDAEDGFKTLAKYSKPFSRGKIKRVWGTAYAQSSSETGPFIGGFSNATYTYRTQIKGEVSVRYLGGVRAGPVNPSLGDPDIWGLSLDNFVPTVWELIPYSFLVDYFTNAGDVIDSWSLCKSTIGWACRTERRKSECYHFGFIQDHISNGTNYQLTPPTVKRTRTTISRTTPILNNPGLHFKLPGSSTKFLNIGALLHLRAL